MIFTPKIAIVFQLQKYYVLLLRVPRPPLKFADFEIIFRNVQHDFSSKIPTISFNVSHLKCELSLNNHHAFQTSTLLRWWTNPERVAQIANLLIQLQNHHRFNFWIDKKLIRKGKYEGAWLRFLPRAVEKTKELKLIMKFFLRVCVLPLLTILTAVKN